MLDPLRDILIASYVLFLYILFMLVVGSIWAAMVSVSSLGAWIVSKIRPFIKLSNKKWSVSPGQNTDEAAPRSSSTQPSQEGLNPQEAADPSLVITDANAKTTQKLSQTDLSTPVEPSLAIPSSISHADTSTEPSFNAELKSLIHFGAYLDQPKKEDRIKHGIFANKWPYIIVADGVAQVENATGEIRTGGSGITAENVIVSAEQHLEETLPEVQDVEGVLNCLRDAYSVARESLASKQIGGATTLLIALLWTNEQRATKFWCYSYEGDGYITVLSSKHLLDTLTLPQFLLSPQKRASTAAVSRVGVTVPPAAGCRMYEPGDLLYVASDGIDLVNAQLLAHLNITLHHFLVIKGAPEKLEQRVYEVLRPYKLGDDAVLGVIWPPVPTNSSIPDN
jgi:hypothetical protein